MRSRTTNDRRGGGKANDEACTMTAPPTATAMSDCLQGGSREQQEQNDKDHQDRC
jgi:hypothetical protein